MTQSLAQLQAEWRATANDLEPVGYDGSIDGRNSELASAYLIVAGELQPHVEREAAAQAKSLADERRIADLTDQLSAERTRRMAAEKVVDAANDSSRLEREPGVVLDEVSGLAGIYRTQYPRVEEEEK